MNFSASSIVLAGSIILLAAVLAGKAGSRYGIPSLLLFLGVGMLFGSDGAGIQFNNSQIAQFIGMLALSIILFSGGMDTRIKDIRPVAAPGVVLATLGVVLSAFITGAFIYGIGLLLKLNLSFTASLLMASVMSSTDSASVFSILRSKRQGLKQHLRPLLELESGSNDPMAYIMTLMVLGIALLDKSIGWQQLIVTFLLQICIGITAGYLFGKAAAWTINRVKLQSNSLATLLLVAFVFLTFSVTDKLQGNGYLAVYIAGLVTGNSSIVGRKSLARSMDGYTWLFQIIMFISLGLLVNPHELIEPKTATLGLTVGLFMILFARPIVVFLCLLPFRKFSFKARLYVGWVGLRGAVPIIFATYPLVEINRGFDADVAHTIFNTVFFITILSLAVQGTTVSWFAKKLGLTEDETTDSFGIDLPDKIKAALSEITVDSDFLAAGNTLKDIMLPSDSLVLLVKRGEKFIVPRGNTSLESGDVLLVIAENREELNEELKELDIKV